jgi:hypothetical protein
LGDKAVAAITAADVRAFRLARHPYLLGDLRHRQSITDHRHQVKSRGVVYGVVV